MKALGIDIGALSIGAVLVDGKQVVATHYAEHRGDIHGSVRRLLERGELSGYDRVGLTGTLSGEAGAIDPILAVSEGARHLLPGCRNVLSIGGESFALILFDEKGEYREHSINSPCAAGTGSFIAQAAERLNLSVGALAVRADAHTGPTPTIATRCAVFAKTDMIHAMQEGYSLDSLCAGLCEGIARNVLDVLVKGRGLLPPVGLVGGVSLNRRIVRSIEQIVGLPVEVPELSPLAGAVGAALLATDGEIPEGLASGRLDRRAGRRTPLHGELAHYPDFADYRIYTEDEVEVLLPAAGSPGPGPSGAAPAEGAYLGIDVGSTSTKAVVLDERRRVLAGVYTATAGDPARAVGRLTDRLEALGVLSEAGLRGAATTGSGRKLIRELFRADLDIDEITAHAKAAVFLTPEVDTILEIGGQDSKFTRLKAGEVYFSTMNYACAAGTGSFIEEQAKRLGVSLQEFSDMALGAEAPYTSDRCTVYMERDLGVLLGEGWSREALAAAVLHSVRDNYLAKVVSRSPLGDYLVFQGATARNRALVAAFEQALGKPIHVSPYCHLTGAMGAALACLEAGLEKSGFASDLENLELEQEVCTLCANHCLLTVAVREGLRVGWGMKCGRDYSNRQRPREREAALESRRRQIMEPALEPADGAGDGVRAARAATMVVIPALYNAEYAPLWVSVLRRLGYRTRVLRPSRKALARGKGVVNSDFCAPMVMAHGYVAQAVDEMRGQGDEGRGPEYLFCPAVVNEEDPDYDGELLFRKKTSERYFCYYSQYLPTIVGNLTTLELGDRLLSPLIFFNRHDIGEIGAVLAEELRRVSPELDTGRVQEAFAGAYAEFQERKARLARTFVPAASPDAGGPLRVLLLGRPYVTLDPVLSLQIPRKLEELGAEVYAQEELDAEGFEPLYAARYCERMNWHYGRRILALAELCARSENLYPVFLTSFRCSPDSFLISYLKDIFDHYGRPFLILQLDEHSSDVGISTRIEAALRSFAAHRRAAHGQVAEAAAEAPVPPRNDPLEPGDTVLVPYIDALTSRFWTASFRRAGFAAHALEAGESSLSTGYQYANGGECMPLVSIMGGVIEKVRTLGLAPEKTFFFMPTSCFACNFPQFPILSDLVFRAAGLQGLKIGLINNMAMAESLPQSLAARIFEANIVGSILHKISNRIRPYEVRAGETEAALGEAAEGICDAIAAGGDLRQALGQAVERFRRIERDESGGRKPRIAILGDLYVKYSAEVNQNLQALIEKLGGELVVPSLTEYALHYYYMDQKFSGDDPRHYKLLRTIEARYERIAEDLLGEQREPDLAEGVALMEGSGFRHYIAGETSINVGRALHHIHRRDVEAIVHVNPIFCCPGVVTASIYRRMQEQHGVPIVDIFYDGTGSPNRVLIPHLHYLTRGRGEAGSV